MAIDSSQYNFMLSAADTMADNYRMQEEAERQERERVYKRKMLEEAMAQKKKAEEEAQLLYKRQQEKAKDNAFMYYAVTGNVPSAQPVASYTNPGTSAKNKANVPSYTNPGTSAKNKANVPSHTTGTAYAPPAYIPTRGGNASAALYLFNANAATDENKKNLIVSSRLSPSNYEKQVFNVGLSEQGKQLLRDYYGYTDDDIKKMPPEQQAVEVNHVLESYAIANALSKKQDVVDARNGLADWGNIIQLKKREKASAKSTDDMFDKLDARIEAAEEELKNDKELIYYRNMASGILSDPKWSKLRDERIKYIRDKHNLDGLIAYRDALQKEYDLITKPPKLPSEASTDQEAAEILNRIEADKQALVGQYNRKIAEQYQLVPLLPDVTAENVTPEEVSEEYKRLRKDGGNNYFTTTQKTVDLDERDSRYVRYKDIKEAEAKGEFNEVYNLLTEEERKRLFPNYDPEKQREFNYRYELKKKAEAERQKAEAFKAKKAEVEIKELENKKLQQEFAEREINDAADAAMLIRNGVKYSQLPARYKNAILKEWQSEYGHNEPTDQDIENFSGAFVPAGWDKFDTLYRHAAREMIPQAEKEQKEKQNKTNLARATEAARINNPFVEYKPTDKDIKDIADLISSGMDANEAAKHVFYRIEQEDKRSHLDPEKQLKKGVSIRVNSQLIDIFGTQYGKLDPEKRIALAKQYNIWAAQYIPQKTRQLIAKNVSEMSDEEIDYVIRTLTDASEAWKRMNNGFDSPTETILINVKKEKIKRKKTFAGKSDPAYMWHNKYPEYANGTLSYANLFPIIPQKDAEYPDANFVPKDKDYNDSNIKKACKNYERRFPQASQRNNGMREIYELFRRYANGYKVTPSDRMSKEEKLFWTEVLPALTEQYRLNLLLDEEKKTFIKKKLIIKKGLPDNG